MPAAQSAAALASESMMAEPQELTIVLTLMAFSLVSDEEPDTGFRP